MTTNQLILNLLLLIGVFAIGVVMFYSKNKTVVSWSQLFLAFLLALIVTTNELGAFESNFFWVIIIANAGFALWGLRRKRIR